MDWKRSFLLGGAGLSWSRLVAGAIASAVLLPTILSTVSPTYSDGERPGEPVYFRHMDDCVTGDHFIENRANNQPDPGCDSYRTDLYERPFNNSNQVHFFADLDIVRTSIGSDGNWFYCRVDLYGLRSGSGLDAM